jgi:hypothetical protein
MPHYNLWDNDMRLNWIGEKYGRLTVRELHSRRGNKKLFFCVCDCGAERVVQDSNLRSGHTTSCGCRHDEQRRLTHRTHGQTKTAEHDIWVNIKQRCLNPSNPAFPRYGGRGITICPEWRDDFAAFFAHVGPRPSPDMSIDRIDNDRGYEPGNVRWATNSEQARNRRPLPRNGQKHELDGRWWTVQEIAKERGIPPTRIYNRLENGWSFANAVNTPPDTRYQAVKPADRTAA